MFLCNSWFLKRQHRKKQNTVLSNNQIDAQRPVRYRDHRKKPSNKYMNEIRESQIAVAESESDWTFVIEKEFADKSQKPSSSLCYSTGHDVKQKQGNPHIDDRSKIEGIRRMTIAQVQSLRQEFTFKKSAITRTLSDSALERRNSKEVQHIYDRPLSKRHSSLTRLPSSFISYTNMSPDQDQTTLCIQESTSQNDPITNESANVPTTPAWFSEMNQRAMIKANYSKDPNHSWAASQIFQMHYEIRESIGKRLNTNLPNYDVYDWG